MAPSIGDSGGWRTPALLDAKEPDCNGIIMQIQWQRAGQLYPRRKKPSSMHRCSLTMRARFRTPQTQLWYDKP